MLKVAMIGCGGIGGYHMSHLETFTDIIEIVGMCDLIEEKAKNYAERVGARAYTDFRTMLDAEKPEAVFVCVPPDCHGEIEMELLARKLPFFVEKPLSVDMAQANAIAKEIEKAGLITAVGFQCRYDMLNEHVQSFVRENTIPYIDCTRFGGVPGTEWFRVKSRSGGQLVEQTIHQLDYIRYVFGEPETVFSMASRGYVKEWEGYDTDDLSATVVRFENGALATVATGIYATGGNAFDSKVVFSSRDKRGEMHLISDFKVYGEVQKKQEEGGFVIADDGGVSAASGDAVVYKEEGDCGFACDRTFLEAVISGDGSKIRSPYSDALKSLAFAMACNASMETGMPVKVADMFLK